MITKAEQKFLTSTQEARRLSIALERFFLVESADWQARYAAYLKRRLRPAMEQLIRAGEIEKIEKIFALGWIDEASLEQFLQMAVRLQRPEILIYFLQQKQQRFGFQGERYEL